jgi:hypothetical protein
MTIVKIPIQDFRRALWNSPIRTVGRDIDLLAKMLQARGQESPVHVNRSNMLVDGHRRFAAAKKIGLPFLQAIVHDVETREEFKKLYAELNDSQRKLGPGERMYAYLMGGPNAVPKRTLASIIRFQELVGEAKFAEYAGASKSCTEAVSNARRVAELAGRPGDKALMAQSVIWQVDTGRQYHLRTALDNGNFTWNHIKLAMEGNRDLYLRRGIKYAVAEAQQIQADQHK